LWVRDLDDFEFVSGLRSVARDCFLTQKECGLWVSLASLEGFVGFVGGDLEAPQSLWVTLKLHKVCG